jgi:hypothetical protein
VLRRPVSAEQGLLRRRRQVAPAARVERRLVPAAEGLPLRRPVSGAEGLLRRRQVAPAARVGRRPVPVAGLPPRRPVAAEQERLLRRQVAPAAGLPPAR